MSTYVWEVSTTSGNPEAIRKAIETAISQLRDPDVSVPALEGIELEFWREDVSFTVVGEAATDGDRTSILIDVSLFDNESDMAAYTAAVLSSGFDTVVGDAVMAIPEVIRYSHSDRIKRS